MIQCLIICIIFFFLRNGYIDYNIRNLAAKESDIVECAVVLKGSLVLFDAGLNSTDAGFAFSAPFTPGTDIDTMAHKDFTVGAFELGVVGAGQISGRLIGRYDCHLKLESTDVVIANAGQASLPNSPTIKNMIYFGT